MAANPLESLNAAQLKAVTTNQGALLIVAGPGTGKTKVITSKILRLLEEGRAPESILAVTFSKRAAQEMISRLQTSVKLSELERMTIGTLHSFCVDLVERHGFRLGFSKKPKLMTEIQSRIFFREVSDRLPIQVFIKTSNLEPVMNDLMNFFQDSKDEGLWPEDILRIASKLPEETEDEQKIKSEWLAIGDIYNAYQSHCFEAGVFDFGDSVLCALRLLEDFPIVREEVRKMYSAILVDEFQDTNWSQIQLLKALAAPQAHIAVVGDDDQSIYKFRGASYSAFQFFKEAFPEVQVVELNETYRLTPEIVEVSTELIAANGEHRFLPQKKLQSKKASGKSVRVIQASDHQDEAEAVVEEIQKLCDRGVSPGEIGVLVRAHSYMEEILKAARNRGLPIQSINSESLYEQPFIRDLLALFRLIEDPNDSVAFLRLLDSSWLRLSADEIYAFCRWASSRHLAFLDQVESLEESPITDSSRERLKKFFSTYKEVFAKASHWSPSELLLHFYEALGIVGHLLERDLETLRLLAQFHGQLHEWESYQEKKELRALLPILEGLARADVSMSDEPAVERDPTKISVLTIHASKGLEFEYVFVCSLVGRRFPSKFQSNLWMLPNEFRREAAPTRESHHEEERRLCYVAFTRAKEQLILTTVDKKGTKPSLFLVEDLARVRQDPKLLRWEVRPARTENLLSSGKLNSLPFARASEPARQVKSDRAKKSLFLSFTQIDKYETCPLAYRFRYDFKIPVRASTQLLVGSAVHFALENFYREIQKGKIPSSEVLVKLFEDRFDEDKKKFPELSELDRNLGREKLSTYYTFHDGRFTTPFAIEKDFVLEIGDHKLRGKIDRVDQNTDGSVTIIDYKTGKAKSEEIAEDRKFAKDSFQLSIYALAAKESFGWNVRDLIFYYVYENSTLTSTRTDEELELAKARINEIAENILSEKFEAKPGFHCRYCEYSRLCPAAK